MSLKTLLSLTTLSLVTGAPVPQYLEGVGAAATVTRHLGGAARGT